MGEEFLIVVGAFKLPALPPLLYAEMLHSCEQLYLAGFFFLKKKTV